MCHVLCHTNMPGFDLFVLIMERYLNAILVYVRYLDQLCNRRASFTILYQRMKNLQLNRQTLALRLRSRACVRAHEAQ